MTASLLAQGVCALERLAPHDRHAARLACAGGAPAPIPGNRACLPPRLRLALGALARHPDCRLRDAGARRARLSRLPERCRSGWSNTFNELTDFGRSGWILIPLACLIVLAAVLSTPSAGRMTNLVLTSLVGAARVPVPGDCTAGTLCHRGQRLHRTHAAVRSRPIHVFAVVLAASSTRACRPGTARRPSRSRLRSARCGRRLRVPVWIFAAVIGVSRVVIQAHFVSDVIAAAFVGGFGAVLVRNWFAARGLAFVPGANGVAARSARPVVAPPEGSCPQAHWPIKRGVCPLTTDADARSRSPGNPRRFGRGASPQ